MRELELMHSSYSYEQLLSKREKESQTISIALPPISKDALRDLLAKNASHVKQRGEENKNIWDISPRTNRSDP